MTIEDTIAPLDPWSIARRYSLLPQEADQLISLLPEFIGTWGIPETVAMPMLAHCIKWTRRTENGWSFKVSWTTWQDEADRRFGDAFPLRPAPSAAGRAY